MKNSRQELILNIISNNKITTQEGLLAKLTEAGHRVTQATVSRDIRQMKLVKIMDDEGDYRYVSPKDPPEDDAPENGSIYSLALIESVRSIDYSMNIVVLKTYPGMASAVAAGIDALKETDILGCVAGDDTVIVIARTTEIASKISGKLTDLMSSNK